MLSAKGDRVAMPVLGGIGLPVRAQLQSADGCWEATYGTASVNDASQLKASD